MRRLKVLHTNFLLGWGGQSNHILLVCRGLHQSGHYVTIACPENSELAKRAERFNLPVFTEVKFKRGFSPLSLWQDARRLWALIAREEFDIMHTHGSQDSWATALACWRKKKPPIIIRTKHNIFPIKDHFFNRWLYGKFFDHIVCISEQIRGECARKSYIPPQKLSVIHSAIAPEKLRPVGEEERVKAKRELGIKDELIIGTVARLRPEKGLAVLLRAMPEVIKKFSNAKLLIAGQGSQEKALKEEAKKLGIAERVIFAGFVADTAPLYAIINFFVMPSLSEGLGTAVMEAGGRGLPIVASRVGGIMDIIENNETGILVEPENSQALAEAIILLATNPELAKRLGDAAREVSLKRFSPETLKDKNEKLYFSLLAN